MGKMVAAFLIQKNIPWGRTAGKNLRMQADTFSLPHSVVISVLASLKTSGDGCPGRIPPGVQREQRYSKWHSGSLTVVPLT